MVSSHPNTSSVTLWQHEGLKARWVCLAGRLSIHIVPEGNNNEHAHWAPFWKALQREARAQGHEGFQVVLPPHPSVALLLSLAAAGLAPSQPGLWWWEGHDPQDISFKAFDADDIPQVLVWFETEDVKKYYAVHTYTPEEIADRFASQLHYPNIQGFMVQHQGQPIGYIQHSPLRVYPWNNQSFPGSVVAQTLCLEMFLGTPETLAQGLGSRMLQAFLKQHIWPTHAFAAVDPWLENDRAIAFYQRNGFVKHKIVEALFSQKPNVPVQLMLGPRPIAFPLNHPGVHPVTAHNWSEGWAFLAQAMHPLNLTEHHVPGVHEHVVRALQEAFSAPADHQCWWLREGDQVLGVCWLRMDAYRKTAVLESFAVPGAWGRMLGVKKSAIALLQKKDVDQVFVAHLGSCTQEQGQAYVSVLGAQYAGESPFIGRGVFPPNDTVCWWRVR